MISRPVFDISRFMHIYSISSYFFKPKLTKEDCLMFIPVPCQGEGANPPRSFTQMRQQGKLN